MYSSYGAVRRLLQLVQREIGLPIYSFLGWGFLFRGQNRGMRDIGLFEGSAQGHGVSSAAFWLDWAPLLLGRAARAPPGAPRQ